MIEYQITYTLNNITKMSTIILPELTTGVHSFLLSVYGPYVLNQIIEKNLSEYEQKIRNRKRRLIELGLHDFHFW